MQNKEVLGDLCMRKEEILNKMAALDILATENSLQHDQKVRLAAVHNEFDAIILQEICWR